MGSAQAALKRLRERGYFSTGFELRRQQELLDLWLVGFGARLIPSLRSRIVSGTSPEELLRRISDGELYLLPAGEAVAPVMRSKESLVLSEEPPWLDAIRLCRLRTDPEGSITLREAFWTPALELSEQKASTVPNCLHRPMNVRGRPGSRCGINAGECRRRSPADGVLRPLLEIWQDPALRAACVGSRLSHLYGPVLVERFDALVLGAEAWGIRMCTHYE